MSAVVAAQTIRLRAEGSSIADGVLSTLMSVEVRQQLSLPAQMTATFVANTDEVMGLPGLGETIELGIDAEPTLFTGEVKGVEREWLQPGLATVTLRAYDALDSLRHERHTAAFDDMSRSEILIGVGENHGLQVEDLTSDLNVLATTLQYAESDLAFFHRMAVRIGAHYFVQGSTLRVFDGDNGELPLPLRFGDDLFQLAIDERSSDHVDTPTILGWHESRANTVTNGSGSPSGGWVLDPVEASTLADAVERASEWERSVASGRAVGSQDITPGRRIKISDVDEPSEFTVVTATHRFDSSNGYITEFSTEPRPMPGPTVAAGYTVALITDLADPDRRGRVRAELLAYGNIRTDWLPVVGPGVGKDRGIVALPDLGDRVIVLGPADDVGAGVILGGIATGAELVGPPVEGDTNERIVARLPNGAAVVLENDGVVIEDGFGSSIEFRDNHVTLHSATDLEIAAPGNALVIRAKTIDFEQS